MRRLLLVTAMLVATAAPVLADASPPTPPPSPSPSPSSPPAARIAPVTDTYFGQSVTDPYRWMEARPPEFATWMRAQDTVTRAELAALPGYPALKADIAAASGATETALAPQLVGDRLFFETRPKGTLQYKLFVASLAGGAPRLLIDPLVAPLGGPGGAIDSYVASPDGALVAVGISQGGSEESVLRVVDVATGKPLTEAIDRARFAGVSWDASGQAFYHNRLKPVTPGMTPDERFRDEIVYRHVVGTDPSADTPVFAAAKVANALGRDGIAGVFVPSGSAWALAMVNSGVSAESQWWVAPAASLARPNVPWVKFAELDAKVGVSDPVNADPIVIGDAAYLLSFKDAPNRRLLRFDLAHPARPPVVVVPEAAGVLVGVTRARDGIYLVRSDGGIYHLSRFDPASGRSTAIPTPYPGTIAEVATDVGDDGLIYSLEGWTRPRLLYHTGASAPLPITAPFPRDLSAYASEELTATAADGTAIPVSVVYRRGLKRDGTAPAIIEGYGAYGMSTDALFSPRLLAWFDRGGVYAVVHVRGGGEFGERWHLAGKGASKPNTWRDFIAGITMLERAGYTSPGKAAGWGTSAGGILIGRTLTERPDLLNAAIVNVGLSDVLRFETSEGGPANTAEFGTVTKPDDYRALYAMSAYHHVVDGTRYPATLLTAGMNDHRVPAWEGAKMAARLQAAQVPGGPPIRLRVEFDAGHGHGSTRDEYDGFYTDMMAFVLRADGASGFGPEAVAADARSR